MKNLSVLKKNMFQANKLCMSKEVEDRFKQSKEYYLTHINKLFCEITSSLIKLTGIEENLAIDMARNFAFSSTEGVMEFIKDVNKTTYKMEDKTGFLASVLAINKLLKEENIIPYIRKGCPTIVPDLIDKKWENYLVEQLLKSGENLLKSF